MTAWYTDSTFYHMYPLGMTGAPKNNPYPWPEEAPAPVSVLLSAPMEELLSWIPHLKQMNFTAVYIGPVFESSSHGYDTRDYRLIDRRLGSNAEFAEFVSQCHENGIRVVIDGVFNHTGR